MTNNLPLEISKEKLIVFQVKKIRKKNLQLTKSWSKEEDKLLISLYKPNNIKKWVTIAKNFHEKDQKDCMLRYLKINPKIKKGKWSYEEDRNLFFLEKMFGGRWALFAKILKNRNHKQIRSRYYHFFLKYKSHHYKEIQRIEESVRDDPPITIL